MAELSGAQPEDEEAMGTANLVARLGGVAPSVRRELLVAFLQEEVRKVLRLSARPAPEIGFFELGFDSLMAVELRSRLNRTFAGAYVAPSTLLFDHPNLARLAEYLAGQVAPAAETRAEDRVAGDAAPAEEELDRLFGQIRVELQGDV